MRAGAIVLAAGRGSRMKAGMNKQFLEIEGKPILYFSLMAFQNNENIDSIIVVASEGEINRIKLEIIEKYNISKVKAVVSGGKERSDSVFNGLKAMKDMNQDIVLIHDGARPFVSEQIISRGIKNALEHGCCACGVNVVDTIKVVDKMGVSLSTPDRNTLMAVQTPQCFKFDIIYKCHKNIKEENYKVTDDTSVVEFFGNKVFMYEGDYNNIKVTTPKDMILAKEIFKKLFTK